MSKMNKPNEKWSSIGVFNNFKQELKDVVCKACQETIVNKKLQWHKDYDCSVLKPKKVIIGKSKLRLKNKKNLTKDSIETITIDSDCETDYQEDKILPLNCEKSKSSLLFDLDEIYNDWKTPESTPVKEDSELKDTNCNNKLYTNSKGPVLISPKNQNLSLHSGLDNSDNEDFEIEKIKFRTPESKHKTQSRISSNKKRSNKENNVHLNDSDQLDSDDNSESFSLYKESGLVTPSRTPSPSPCKKISEKLSNYKISPSIKISPTKFGLKQSPSTATAKTNLQSTPIVKRKLYSHSNSNVTRSPEDNFSQISNTSSSVSLSPSKYRSVNGMYLDNFYKIIDAVTCHSQDIDLFSIEDLKIKSDFNKLSLQARKLYVRLFQRKRRWLRTSSIVYNDICDAEDMFIYVNELIYAGFLLSEKNLLDLEDVLKLLSGPELQKFCKDMKLISTNTKEKTISKILAQSLLQPTIVSAFFKSSEKSKENIIMKRAKLIVGKCLMIDEYVYKFFIHLLMLFSPMSLYEEEEKGQQTVLISILLATTGHQKYPTYTINRVFSIYRSREDLHRLEKCYRLFSELQELTKAQKLDDAQPLCNDARALYEELKLDTEMMKHDATLPAFLRRFTCTSYALHILTEIVEIYQKLKKYKDAVEVLELLVSQKSHLQDYRGRWLDRLALNVEQHLKEPRKSLEIIETAMKDPEVRMGHRLALSQRAERIMASKKGVSLKNDFLNKISLVALKEIPTTTILAKSLPSDIPGCKRIYLTEDEFEGDSTTCCSVEELVVIYHRQEGYSEGIHQEGRTLHVIFGLYFWDIIYTSIADAFRCQYQSAPLDYNSPHFYEARKDAFDARLKQMENSSSEEIVLEMTEVWKTNEGVNCIFDWRIFKSLNQLQGFVASMGSRILAKICQRLIFDHRFTRSGFPDVIIWNPTKKISRIIEVKGPNDRLSTKQMLWLDFLLSIGAVAEVCHVEAMGARRGANFRTFKLSPAKPAEECENSPKKKNLKKRKQKKEEMEDEFQKPDKKKLKKEPKKEFQKPQKRKLKNEEPEEEFQKPLKRKLKKEEPEEEFQKPLKRKLKKEEPEEEFQKPLKRKLKKEEPEEEFQKLLKRKLKKEEPEEEFQKPLKRKLKKEEPEEEFQKPLKRKL